MAWFYWTVTAADGGFLCPPFKVVDPDGEPIRMRVAEPNQASALAA